jgi:hypothetical protein
MSADNTTARASITGVVRWVDTHVSHLCEARNNRHGPNSSLWPTLLTTKQLFLCQCGRLNSSCSAWQQTVLQRQNAAETLTNLRCMLYVRRAPTDSEVLWFRASRPGTATLQVMVQPNYPNSGIGRSNLNLRLRVLDATGAEVVGSARSGIGVAAYAVTLPAAGIYYTAVAGVGAGADATTGYTSYGSRGVYQLIVTYPSNGSVEPPAPLQVPLVSASAQYGWTGSVRCQPWSQQPCTCCAVCAVCVTV